MDLSHIHLAVRILANFIPAQILIKKTNNHLLQKNLEIQGKDRIILKINKNVPCALCTASRPQNGP